MSSHHSHQEKESVGSGSDDQPKAGMFPASKESGISIEQSKEDFKDLERTLSKKLSTPSNSRDPSKLIGNDIERGEFQDVEGPFDLRDYLNSANDANARAGIKHKHVGVTWKDLEVKVFGGTDYKVYVRTFGTAVLEFWLTPYLLIAPFISRLIPSKSPVPTRTVLHKSSGYLKPGEMCLVLGIPGSGCTTFLKAISNQRDEFLAVNGEVLYAGIGSEEIAKTYRGEVVFNQEDDIHISTLTVAQTLHFALSTKTPTKRASNVTKKEFNTSVLNSLLRMLNISHTSQTLVGDAFVRGVSGGERKRVSIAEMMTTRARVQCWDGSTRGLDAATALDFVKCLRIMTDILGQTTFVSLYQAGDQIYRLFDKVLVLDQGRQVYFGSPEEARHYFVDLGYKDLPRQSTADYLTGCTDPHERQFAESRLESTVAHGPEGLEKAFRNSSAFKVMIESAESYRRSFESDKQDQLAFRQSVLDDKRKGVSKLSPYTLGYWGQVKALTVRQFQLRLQDRFGLYTSYIMSATLALVIGATYFELPQTSAGGFTRGSLIFVAMLTSCLEAFSELPSAMLGRPILNKQTGFSFYQRSTIAWANLFADLPLTALRVFIFNVIIFFMSGLSRSAGSFWTFALFNYFAFLVMQGFFRFFGMLCTSFDSAFRLGTFFIPNFVSYAGYVIPVFKMKRWLFWIYYINPLNYGFSALLENEFSRINLMCDGNFVIPRNIPQAGLTRYPNSLGPNQVCTLFGAKAGTANVVGADYLQIGFRMNVNDRWRLNLPALVAFFVFFQALQVWTLEYWRHRTGGAMINIFSKESATTANENEVKDDVAPVESKQRRLLEDGTASNKVFTWENVNYTVPVGSGERRLLTDVFGYVKPGTLTALMGASGAGKTTCLDVLAQRKNIGIVTGDILIDGRPLEADFARGTAYAEQMDVHEGTATVREALQFSAYLRQSHDVPQAEKDEYVEEIITMLELQSLSDALIYSLNSEARKRLTIGVELASKPRLLLFLDEPTSGLDGQSAWNLVRFLRKLSDAGQAILCTIHQPSALLFESFDRLLLLESGGRTVYHGPIGPDSMYVRAYFARHGALCPDNANPAEYMLEAIGAGTTPRVGLRDWHDIWLDSPERQTLNREIQQLKEDGFCKPQVQSQLSTTYASPFYYQLKIVSARALVALWRSPDYIFTRLFVHVFISLMVSLSLLQLGQSVRDLQYRVFGIFWATVMPAIVMGQVEPAFIINRMIFVREASSRIYSPYVFALGQVIAESPYSVLCAILYWVFAVWPMGFGKGANGTNGNGYQLLMIIFVELFGVTLGQVVAALSPSIRIAALFNPFLTLVLTTYAGVTIPFPSLAKFWRSWLYQLTPYTRVLSGMLSTELKGLEITCLSDEFAVFNPPSGSTCQSWAGDFVRVAGGYLDNPSDTADCRYCQYRHGDEFFQNLNIQSSNRWRDLFIVLLYTFFNVAVTVVASRFLRFAKR